MLNAVGNVVGITTAIVSDSQGLGFAIPSDTILREVSALVDSRLIPWTLILRRDRNRHGLSKRNKQAQALHTAGKLLR